MSTETGGGGRLSGTCDVATIFPVGSYIGTSIGVPKETDPSVQFITVKSVDIANCTLCHREKAKVQSYPLQMIEIPERPFNKIAIDLVTECKTSTSGNKHILTIINHLTG